MRSSTLFFATIAPVLVVSSICQAQTSFPMITHSQPVAVQRGRTTEVMVAGRMNFYGTYKAIFEGTGISAEVLTKPAKKAGAKKVPQVSSIKLKVKVAADADLGVREFRLASSLGISSIGQIVIVDDPVVQEISTNNTLAQAQAIKLPSVVAGRLEVKEDVDFFSFSARAGDHITFEVWCARIQDKIHDLQKHAKPMIVLHDADGRELAANDHFYFADPMLSYKIPKTGTYYVQIRESTYDGDPRWVYALLATYQPYASHVYPMAGNPGKTITVEPVGSAREVAKQVQLTAPKEPGIHRVQLNLGAQKTYPVTFLVSTLPQALEKERNDTPEQATRITLPCGINGRLQKQRDLDHFIFKAKKGKAIRFEVKARRFGTELNSTAHPVIDIMTAKGQILASNTDTHSLKEATLVFTPKANGDYVLRVRDLNSKGGPAAVYFVEADWARPDFTIACDPDKAMIGPGSSTAWFVQVKRENGFAGPVEVKVKGLPAGVRCSPLTIPPSMTQGVIVVTASEKATQTAGNVILTGSAKIKDAGGKEKVIVRQADVQQEIYSPGGGRAIFPVNMQTVAVTDPSDIMKVNVKPSKIVLKPGQEVKIEVELQRHPRYTKNVSLDILLRHLSRTYGDPLPKGVTIVAGKSKTSVGKGSKGHIVLKAAANAAPVENVPIAVLAHVSINFVVKVSYASPPILLSVRK